MFSRRGRLCDQRKHPEGWHVRIFVEALNFAAVRHRTQRRKGRSGAPYINHLIEVAHLLTIHGEVDEEVLAAAVLHDAVEDVGVTEAELRALFGDRVADLVMCVSDDMALPTWERKLRQVEHAGSLSPEAQNIKVADKISNLRGILTSPPEYWSLERKQAYYRWAREVVRACHLANPGLLAMFDDVYASGLTCLVQEHRTT